MPIENVVIPEGQELTRDTYVQAFYAIMAELTNIDASNLKPNTLIPSTKVRGALNKYGDNLEGPLYTDGNLIDGVSIEDLRDNVDLLATQVGQFEVTNVDATVTINEGVDNYDLSAPSSLVSGKYIEIDAPSGYTGLDAIVNVSLLGTSEVSGSALNATDYATANIAQFSDTVRVSWETSCSANSEYSFGYHISVLWQKQGVPAK